MTLKEEIAKLLWQIYVRNEYGIEEYKDEYRYEYGVHNWTKYTEQEKKGYLEEADQILKLFEKLIDEKITLIESIHKDCLACDGEIIRLEELKEELSK